MRGYCAKCGGTFSGQMLCPQCGIRLHSDKETGESTTLLGFPEEATAELPDGPSPFRRIAVGLLLIVGIYQGTLHLLQSYQASPQIPALWDALVLVAATLVAAISTGTGSRMGMFTGLMLGAGAAIVFLRTHNLTENPLPQHWMVGLPSTLALVGALGGLVGRMIVLPAPRVPKFAVALKEKKKEPRAKIKLLPVLCGSLLAMMVQIAANPIRETLATIMGGHGQSFAASKMVIWQISALGVFLGGLLAGANTRQGLIQGLMVSLFVVPATIAAYLKGGTKLLPSTEFWNDQLRSTFNDSLSPVVAGIAVGCIAIAGGWLGGQLFPPPHNRRPVLN